MSTVYCSTNLVSLIGKQRLSVVHTTDFDPLSKWNARLFYINRRKCILFTNKATLYSLVRLDILKKDLSDLTSFFLNSLVAQLQYDGFYNAAQINYWQENLHNIRFTGTDNDKKVIGSMNDYIYQLELGLRLGSTLLQEVNDITAANYLNTIPMRLVGWKYPREKFREAIGNV